MFYGLEGKSVTYMQNHSILGRVMNFIGVIIVRILDDCTHQGIDRTLIAKRLQNTAAESGKKFTSLSNATV